MKESETGSRLAALGDYLTTRRSVTHVPPLYDVPHAVLQVHPPMAKGQPDLWAGFGGSALLVSVPEG